ncbi:MAG: hypothetical protein WC457_02815 [Patescibacteria group bacterium]
MKDKKENVLTPYICYALTELPPEIREWAKAFYAAVADKCKGVIGVRGFVPHEHYDPVANANFTPQQVDCAERRQVCKCSSVVIVVALAPSWGGGIEVEMANQNGVPVIILCEKDKLEKRLVSRLLRGNPAVREVIAFKNEEDALLQLSNALRKLFPEEAAKTLKMEMLMAKRLAGAQELQSAFDAIRRYGRDGA